jgi:SAM-dependent methyltransferase
MKTGNTYNSYDDYLEHQATKAKTPKWIAKLQEDRKKRLDWFKKQFSLIMDRIPIAGLRKVLCLGARFGEEVISLKKLGISAVGIDIEACLPHVVVGDMNNLKGYRNLDMIYTNAMDHCWDIDSFIKGIKTALKPGGYFVMHNSFGVGQYEHHVPESPNEIKLFVQKQLSLIYDEKVAKPCWTLAHLFIFQKTQ